MSNGKSGIISLVIVTYNSEKVIEKCIQSIKKNNYAEDKTEIFVVDNNSQDKTKEVVRRNFKDVKIVKLSKNFGYAYACNRGTEKASGAIIILLNPDVLIANNFLKEVHNFIKRNYFIGGLAPRMTDIKGTMLTYPKIPTIFNRIYKYSGLYGLLHHDEVLYHNLKGIETPTVINNIEGPVVIFPRFVFSKIGLLNESFFLTHELTEFSLRIQRSGLKLYYLPSAKITHLISKSTGTSAERILTFVHKAEMQFFRISHGKIKSFLVRTVIILLLLIKIPFLFVRERMMKCRAPAFNSRVWENFKLLKLFFGK